MDSVTGGAADDKIFGTFDGNNDTFNASDVIAGGAGNDTLNVTLGADYTGGGTISGIETIAIKSTAANNNFDVNGLEGITLVKSERSTADVTVDNIASTSTVLGLSTLTNVAADLTANFTDSALNGTNDTVTVNLTGGIGNAASAAGDNVVTVASTAATNGAENLLVNVSGGAAYVDLISVDTTGGGNSVLKKVTVTGDKLLTVGTTLDFVGTDTATFDASATTGGVKAGMDENITKMSVVGGSGNDYFTMSTGLNTTDTIDGGAGTDTVVAVGANGAATTFTLADQHISNVEIFRARSDTGDALVLATNGQVGLTTVQLLENATTDIAMTVADLAAGVAVELINDTDTAKKIGEVALGLKDASGTADSLTVTLKGTSGHDAADNTIDKLTVGNLETLALVSSHEGTTALLAADTNTITSLVADTSLTKVTASGSDALSVTLSGAETNLSLIDASAMTDVATVDVSNLTSNISIKTGSEDDLIAFGATLNNKDSVDGGANSTDTTNVDVLTATVTSLTATTGALNVANVERLNLTNAGTTIIDATAVTGATEINILTNTTKATVSGLAAGVAVGLGATGVDGTADGELNVALKDATGTADTITINLNDTDDTQTTTATLKASGIETVTVNVNSTTDAAMADSSLTVSALNAAKVVVTGSKADAGNTMSLNTLDTDTKTLDASGYYGILTATAGSATATSMTVRGGAAHNLTGSSANDTIVVTATTANAAYTINGNGGTDSLTIGAANGAMDLDGVSDVDSVTLNVNASAAVTFGVDAGTSDGLNAAETVKITGGNSLSTVTIGVTPTGDYTAAHATTDADGSFGGLTGATTTLFDASGFAGKLTNVVFTADGLDDSVTVKGTANAGDKVTAIYANGKTIKSMTGVETLEINATGTVAIDLKNVDDVTKIMLDDDGTARVVTLTDLDVGVAIEVEHGVTASGVVIDLIDSSATADSVTVDIKTVNAGTDTYSIATAALNDIETLNLVMSATSKIDLTNFAIATASKTSTVTVTGAGDLTLTAINADVATINGADMTGALVMEARSSTSAMTITSAGGADTIYMKHGSDVLNAGDGADTLNIVANFVLGGLAVDLSSTVDQVTSYNGSANSAVQKGFESADLSGITGTFGADITANSAGGTIAGTINNDQISGGAGTDNIQFKGGTAMTAGTLTSATGVDTILNFTGGTDNLYFSNASFGDDLTGAGGEGALAQTSVGVFATTGTALNTANNQIDGAGAITVTDGAFAIVGTNATGNTVALYFLDAGATLTNDIATEVAAGHAEKIADITIVGSALTLADFYSMA